MTNGMSLYKETPSHVVTWVCSFLADIHNKYSNFCLGYIYAICRPTKQNRVPKSGVREAPQRCKRSAVNDIARTLFEDVLNTVMVKQVEELEAGHTTKRVTVIAMTTNTEAKRQNQTLYAQALSISVRCMKN